MTQSHLPYEENDTESEKLCYAFIEAYEQSINRDAFLNRMKDVCPDVDLLDAIWCIIDLLTLGGRP